MGKPFGDIEIARGASMLFLGEETSDEISRRFGAICAHLSQSDRRQVERLVFAFPMAGNDLRLTKQVGGNAEATDLQNRIIELCNAHAVESGEQVKLIVLDHARLLMGGDPNAAQDVTALTTVLTHIAGATGASILMLAHSPKSILGKEAEIDAADIAGSSAFVDNARSAMLLVTMTEVEAKRYDIPVGDRHFYVRLKVVKNNYGKTGTEWWFGRKSIPDYGVAVLEPIKLSPLTKQSTGNAGLEQRIIDLIGQYPGALSRTKVRDTHSGKQGTLKASGRDVAQALDRMFSEGKILTREPTKEERKEHDLTHNVKQVLDLPEGAGQKVPGKGCGVGDAKKVHEPAKA